MVWSCERMANESKLNLRPEGGRGRVEFCSRNVKTLLKFETPPRRLKPERSLESDWRTPTLDGKRREEELVEIPGIGVGRVGLTIVHTS